MKTLYYIGEIVMAMPVLGRPPHAQQQQAPILVHLSRVLRAIFQLIVERDPIIYGILAKKPPEPREVWRIINRYNFAKTVVAMIDDEELKQFFITTALEPLKAKIDAITPLPHIQFLKPIGGGDESPIAVNTAEFITGKNKEEGENVPSPSGLGGNIVDKIRQMEKEVREFEMRQSQQQQEENEEGE